MDFFKRLACIFLAMLLVIPASGAKKEKKPLNLNGYADTLYTVGVHGLYCYSNNMEHYGGADIRFHLPIHKYFQMRGSVEQSGKYITSTYLALSPQYRLGPGEFFIDVTTSFRNYGVYKSYELVNAFTAGYRFRFISLQVGAYHRLMGTTSQEPGQKGSTLSEGWQPAIRCMGHIMPSDSKWNIALGAGTFNDYEFERFFALHYMIEGTYSVTNHFRVEVSMDLKPSGMFHMMALFNGACVKAGLSYMF